ncbi:MAG: PH domain-containing protein [Lacipirellulaceae bacterium]
MTNNPIAGVHPPEVREATVATAWPSIAAGRRGRWLGRLAGNRLGVRLGGVPLTLGWGIAIATAPLAAALYLGWKAPRWPLIVVGPRNPRCRRYRVTNRRLLVERPLEKDARIEAELPLDAFDEVRVEVLPGQEWYKAGDLVFVRCGAEAFRLAGVSRPEAFRQIVLKTQRACVRQQPAA